jgi:superfamily II DNA/RNA helicase
MPAFAPFTTEQQLSPTFIDLGVPAKIAAHLEKLGITEPYAVQSATLPDGLAGRDVFAQSPTGSGKTLAFAIPLIARVARASHNRPRALVLAPTRELAAQITEAIRPLARLGDRYVAAFYGGDGYRNQLQAIRRGVDIAVGCPGRLADLVDRGALDLSEVQIAVVDEADRMADMGFLPQVQRLLDEISGPRQTMLFSATMNKDVERLVRTYQHQPVRHLLVQPESDPSSRSHEFWRTDRGDRAGVTAEIVEAHGSCIVFCRTKRGADRVTRQLNETGMTAVAIHGDRSQAQRERALQQFRSKRARVLVGTDVASRGIHVDGVDCVIHFDLPEDSDTYVHRSGRTGRAGASGRVISLVSPDQERVARDLVSHLGLDARLSSERKAARPTVAGAVTPQSPRRESRPSATPSEKSQRRVGPRATGAQPVAARKGSRSQTGRAQAGRVQATNSRRRDAGRAR